MIIKCESTQKKRTGPNQNYLFSMKKTRPHFRFIAQFGQKAKPPKLSNYY